MLPGVHDNRSDWGNTALQLGDALTLLKPPACEEVDRPRTVSLVEHTLGGEVEVADLEAVMRPIHQAVGAYARLAGPARDLAWEKCQWCLAVEGQMLTRGLTEPEAVTAANLLPADRWPHLLSSGKRGRDQRNKPNYRRWKEALGTDHRGRIRGDQWHALAKKRGGGQVSTVDPGFMLEFFRLYLQPRCPGIEPARRKIERVFRLRGQAELVPSEEQVRLAVAKAVTPTLERKYRSTAATFANEVRGWIKRAVNAAPGEIWFMDHRIADFWCRTTNAAGEAVAVRPYITAVFDAASFTCLSVIIYCDTHPNHARILEAFEAAVCRAGNRCPRVLYIDNGKDFLKLGLGTPVTLSEKRHKGTVLCDADGEPLRYSVMQALGVTVHTAAPYNGKEKPIERWFRDMASDWEKFREGYCGNHPGTRPDFGDTWQGDAWRLETVAQAMTSLESWIAEEANQQPKEDGLTRAEMWNRRNLTLRPVLSEVDLAVRLLLPHRVTPLVGRTSMGGGVAFAGWSYSHADLRPYWGKPVLIKTCWSAPRVEVPVQTRSRGKVHREVPACIFVFDAYDDTLIAGAVADPVFEMCAESEAARARIGAAQHLINAIAARDSQQFEALTGRQRVASPARVLAELEAPAGTAQTVALSADPAGGTRRLRGDASADPLPLPAPAVPKETVELWDSIDEMLLEEEGETGSPREVGSDADLDVILEEAIQGDYEP